MTQVATPASARSNRFPVAALAAAGLTHLLQAASQAWRRHRNRREIAELLRYDDHMLADLGITRTDVSASLAADDFADPSQRLCHLRNERRAAWIARRSRRA